MLFVCCCFVVVVVVFVVLLLLGFFCVCSDISLERQGMVDQCATPQELVKGFGPVMKLE